MNRPVIPTALRRLALLASVACSPAALAQDDGAPTAPGALRATIYSTTAAELFWERSRDDGRVAGYEIRRNGTLLDTRDATSYFDASLVPGTGYAFTVTAIDTEGNRSAAGEVSLTTRPGPADPDGSDIRPLALRVDVYSDTALELFWRRDARREITTYEVRRDGVPVATLDGTSFFDDGLEPGTSYRYEVTALDADAPPAAIESVTNGGAAPTSSADLLGGVNLVIYSDTAAELLWERPDAAGGVNRVEVLRDGESLGRTDGTSYFDDDRVPGASHRYTLLPRDVAGNVLERITVSDPDGGIDDPENRPPAYLSPIIAEYNATEAIAFALSVFEGDGFGDEVIALPGLSDPAFDVGAPDGPMDGVCDNGGTVSADLSTLEGGETTVLRRFEFDDCLDGSALLDGNLERRSHGFETARSTGFTRIDGADALDFSGLVVRREATGRDGGPGGVFTVDDVDLRLGREGDRLVISNGAFAHITDVPFAASKEGGYRVRSPRFQNTELTVTITERLRYSATSDEVSSGTTAGFGFFQTGTMVIRTEDGTTITVTADNGQDDTFEYTLDSGERSYTSEVLWRGFGGSLNR